MTKITDKAHLDQVVQESLDADQTLFVRWIASPGWGWWRKQAPAWNEATEMYKANDKVRFADINLSEASDTRGEPYNAGAGGWPTVRYFNSDTGKDGAPYDKKTDKSMCDELGDIDYMTAYIEEAGKTSLCAIDGSGCDERSAKYMAKMKVKSKKELEDQLKRLEGMEGKEMKQDLKQWVRARKKLLKVLMAHGHDEL